MKMIVALRRNDDFVIMRQRQRHGTIRVGLASLDPPYGTALSLLLSLVAACVMLLPGATAAAMPAEDAWKALANYEYGKDMAALLTIDREVIPPWQRRPAGRRAPRGWPAFWRRPAQRPPRNSTSAANFDKWGPRPRSPPWPGYWPIRERRKWPATPWSRFPAKSRPPRCERRWTRCTATL